MNTGELAKFFSDQGYEWNFSNGRRVPSAEEIDKTILSAIDALKNEGDNTEVEVGRLVVKKRGSWYDVFVLAAEIPNVQQHERS